MFNCSTTLNAHMRVHGEDETYSCSKCGKKFQWYAGLQEHMQQHDGYYNKHANWKIVIEDLKK